MHARIPTRSSLVKTTNMLMAKHNVPGLAISIFKGGEGGYSEVFGKMYAGESAEVSTSTLFRAASLSKLIFAFGIFKLIDEGVLDLDSPLNDYLPKR